MKRLIMVLLALAMGTLIATTTPAQIPDTYTNLKILPKDIKKAKLMQYMKDYSKALGVRCHFCHKGEEGKSLSTYDFASDENYHKDLARAMMIMTTKINTELLKDFKDGQFAQVQCITCHRGKKEPEN